MYESREEAIDELAPKSEHAVSRGSPLESWSLRRLSVMRLDGSMVVQFPQGESLDGDAAKDLREDFAELADTLDRDSKVLLDFTGVTECPPLLVDTLVSFCKRLRTRGSRLVLCCLGTSAQKVFFSRTAS